jgi:demethylmenaquinone methyltransferase/2-methoxy-6-polyprenyl-1,4-benzoquinol methylase
MFGSVAARYDFLNHLLSFNADRYWRNHTAESLREVLLRPDARVLDICCGTGDLTLALERSGKRPVMGSDFCHPMLVTARRKLERQRARSFLFEGDALVLPISSGSLDLITVAFGLRNFANYRKGLIEMRRVLKPGGTAAVLEFSRPPNRGLALLYDFYSLHVLPRIGAIVSGSSDAYTYLPESVRKFSSAEDLAREMRDCGFRDVRFEFLTFGIVALHTGVA